MTPDRAHVALGDNPSHITKMLMELILLPRRDLVKWAKFTKQTPNIRIGYPGQHLASLVTGVEGARTGARGHDLIDGSEVKSCSRVDQLDKCMDCKAAVARLETICPECSSMNITRNNDSKWLFTVRSDEELATLLDDVPRVVLILSDYPYFDKEDWTGLRFQVFEIWPQHQRHEHFRTIMKNYLLNIYYPHIERSPTRTPAPKNLWPDSFQFYMCNPVRTFHCIASDATSDPRVDILEYVEPMADRRTVKPVPMPLAKLNREERELLRSRAGEYGYRLAAENGLDEEQRLAMDLRDTDHASPQRRSYRRGVR